MAVSRLSQTSLQNAFQKYNNTWDGRSAVGAMDAISGITLTSSFSSINFNNIPSTYTHLQIRGMIIGDAVSQTGSTSFQINGDGNANYTRSQFVGGSSAAAAYAVTGDTKGHIFGYNDNVTTVYPMVFIMDVLDYTNTNKYKTSRVFSGLERNNNSPYGDVNIINSLWLSTSVVSSISIYIGGQNLAQYSQLTLYGIK